MSNETRDRLLVAASRLVLEEGVARLTLAGVAEAAGVSKGGLLYHFSSKEKLIEAMLDFALQQFEQGVEQIVGDDRSPGAWLRGYIQASLTEGKSELAMYSKIGAALLAGMATDPRMLEPYRQHERMWHQRALNDGIDASRAELIRAGVDGIWLQASLGLSLRGKRERTMLFDALMALTQA